MRKYIVYADYDRGKSFEAGMNLGAFEADSPEQAIIAAKALLMAVKLEKGQRKVTATDTALEVVHYDKLDEVDMIEFYSYFRAEAL